MEAVARRLDELVDELLERDLDGLFEGGGVEEIWMNSWKRFRWRLALWLSELDLDGDLPGLYAFT
jgi:hypothetical protein